MSLPRTLSNSLDAIARKAVGKDWNLYAGLLDHWREIVGESYAKSTAPVKISFPKGKKASEKWAMGRQTGGTLHIRLPQGLAMEFTFLSATIKERINGFFGYEAIERIVFDSYYPEKQPTPPAKPASLTPEDRIQLENETKTIENEELREVLQQLGESVITSEQQG